MITQEQEYRLLAVVTKIREANLNINSRKPNPSPLAWVGSSLGKDFEIHTRLSNILWCTNNNKLSND